MDTKTTIMRDVKTNQSKIWEREGDIHLSTTTK